MGFPRQEYWSGLPLPSPIICISEVIDISPCNLDSSLCWYVGVNVLSHVCAKSCSTLFDPMECSLAGYSVCWIFQARVLELPFLFPWSSRIRDQTCASCIGRKILYHGSSHLRIPCYTFVVVLSLSHVQLFENPWTAARWVSLSFTISLSLLKTHICWVNDSIQPSHPLAPFSSCPQSFPASGSFSNVSALRTRWPKYWSKDTL